ncbi:hypothetical protein [Laspinema olomoucense]|uniref:Uncharacterized protein n=1 Tax=Laspinema olomoucense D3b TaxID=2953688 RepID=A0ABT2N2V6_9CYAN|nr:MULTISPECIES: hypothetical protein [unclassified Laspinema]MCT7974105.1 hypothetical protein [Laspinema sp. D3d]MCT7976998.1 hypothetical protein [Laspinema sp. D3b]MCT7987414.1 hypothetical protein [Laspinema sp. D3a]
MAGSEDCFAQIEPISSKRVQIVVELGMIPPLNRVRVNWLILGIGNRQGGINLRDRSWGGQHRLLLYYPQLWGFQLP